MSKANITQTAEIFGFSEKTVRNHIKEGAPVVTIGGQGRATEMDTAAYYNWLLTRSRGGEDGDPYKEAALGKLQEEEKKLAIGNARELAELVPIDDVDSLFSETLVIFRTSLEGVAGRLSGGNKVLRTKLLNEFRKLLDSAADRLGKYLEEAAAKKQAAQTSA